MPEEGKICPLRVQIKATRRALVTPLNLLGQIDINGVLRGSSGNGIPFFTESIATRVFIPITSVTVLAKSFEAITTTPTLASTSALKCVENP